MVSTERERSESFWRASPPKNDVAIEDTRLEAGLPLTPPCRGDSWEDGRETVWTSSCGTEVETSVWVDTRDADAIRTGCVMPLMSTSFVHENGRTWCG